MNTRSSRKASEGDPSPNTLVQPTQGRARNLRTRSTTTASTEPPEEAPPSRSHTRAATSKTTTQSRSKDPSTNIKQPGPKAQKKPSPASSKATAEQTREATKSATQTKQTSTTTASVITIGTGKKQAKARARELKVVLDQQLEERWKEQEKRDALAATQVRTIRRLSDITEQSPCPGEQPQSSGSDSEVAVEEDEGNVINDEDIQQKTLEDGCGSDSEVSSADGGCLDPELRIQQLQAELDKMRILAGQPVNSNKGKGRPRNNAPGLPLASGLSHSFTLQPTAKERPPVVSVTSLGGLDDADIEDERPTAWSKEHKIPAPSFVLGRRDTSRRNALVSMTEHSQQPSPSPITTTKARPLPPAPRQPKPSAHVSTRDPPANKPRLQASNQTHHQVRQHSQPPTSSNLEASDPGTPRFTASSVRIHHLPDFTMVDKKWINEYLPTLNQLFYASPEPFYGFVVSTPKLVANVQRALELVYPNVSYTVTRYNDPIQYMSYNRINIRRSAIAQDALTELSQHLKSFHNLADANDWLRWAKRLHDGPLFFKDPTPAYCQARRHGEEGYIHPSGRLRSPFVISLLSKALKYSEGAVVDCFDPPPVGLLAIIMAALERAISIVQADGVVPKGVKPFSHENYGEQLAQYTRKIKALTQDQWNEIFKLCGQPDASSSVDHDGDRSAMDIDRQDLFLFESPKKPSVF
ncbi:hypothetical protein CC2G_014256 [Coprinopsis cinerea AmutBmut pab1-1]|nr:hypothetical protein CC2G_014256 [Coprinopsis cinerea AmutBmut pab1-1]